MTHKQAAFASAAESIIKNLEKRNMEGYFFEDSASCIEAIISSIPENSIISWGGSETIKESGLMDRIKKGNYSLLDRDAVPDEEKRKLYAQTMLADYYLMSTNAITLQGELINIDGRGNRVAFLTFGPENVIVLAGMNKLVTDVEGGVKRTRNIAAPANAKRLDKKTPCNATGHCGDCFSNDCMCSQLVITRRSGNKGRIKVYLIAEELGY
jgi:hypothetical protein